MRLHRPAGRARLLLGVVLVVVVALMGGLAVSPPASAAPRDNLANARKCLNGGWRALTTANGRQFHSVVGCVLYALGGGQFGTGSTPPPPPAPAPPPPPPPSPSPPGE